MSRKNRKPARRPQILAKPLSEQQRREIESRAAQHRAPRPAPGPVVYDGLEELAALDRPLTAGECAWVDELAELCELTITPQITWQKAEP